MILTTMMRKTVFAIIVLALVASLALFTLSCASRSTASPAVVGLNDFDNALLSAAAAIGARVPPGTAIVVYRITGPSGDVGEYISDELNGLLSSMTELLVLARESALDALQAEQRFQMSGLVSDTSAASLGHHIGAKIVVSGTLSMFSGFSQLRLRAVDVESAALLTSYSVRISSEDPVIRGISSNVVLEASTSENALAHLDRGKDMLAESNYNDAKSEFDKAIAIDKNLSQAYYWRAIANGDMTGIGSAKESTVNQSITVATDRAKEQISTQLSQILNNMMLDLMATSEVDPFTAVSFFQTLIITIYNSSLSGIRTAHETSDANNTSWVVVQLSYDNWRNEIIQAVVTAKQQHPEMVSFFNMEDSFIDRYWQLLVATQLGETM